MSAVGTNLAGLAHIDVPLVLEKLGVVQYSLYNVTLVAQIIHHAAIVSLASEREPCCVKKAILVRIAQSCRCILEASIAPEYPRALGQIPYSCGNARFYALSLTDEPVGIHLSVL